MLPSPAPSPIPSAKLVLALFGVLLFAFPIFGGIAQLADVPFGLVWTEVFLFFAPAWLLVQGFSSQPVAWLRLGKPTALPIVLGIFVGLANYPLTAALEVVIRSWALVHFPDFTHKSDIAASTLGAVHGGLRVVLVFAIGICAPIGEETAFRGFIQRGLVGRLGRAGGIVLTGFLFAFIHFEPIGGLARMELGMLFGALVLWTGSLWSSIAAHAANNLFATALYYVVGTSGDDTPPSHLEVLQLAAIGIALVVPLLYVAKRFGNPSADAPFAAPEPLGPTARLWASAGLGSWAALLLASALTHHLGTQIAR